MAKQRKTVYQKEMLDEKLKKIDEVFKMVSEIYRNGPTKGLSQIFLREQTPALKRSGVAYYKAKRQLPTHNFVKQILKFVYNFKFKTKLTLTLIS